MSKCAWNDMDIERRIAEKWKANGERYSYLLTRDICREIAHDLLASQEYENAKAQARAYLQGYIAARALFVEKEEA